MKLFKLLIIFIGVIGLSIQCARLGLENKKLKADNVTLYAAANSLNADNINLKSQIEGYQDWIRKIEQGVSRLCPEALKGQSPAPRLRAPQSAPAKPREIPGVEVRSNEIAPDQSYFINGAIPRI